MTKIKKLFLHEPTLSRLELKAVNDCIKTGVVSSSGKQVELFEKNYQNLQSLNMQSLLLMEQARFIFPYFYVV